MHSVTTIIPAYNAEEFLAEAIESVLGQSYKVEVECKIIVVDDGSTDGTAKVANSYPQVQYICQPNSGAAAARNTGLTNCSSDFISFLDADDRFTQDKFEKQFKRMHTDPTLDAVFGHLSEFSSVGESTHRKPVDNTPIYHPGTMLVKKEFADKVGLFNPELKLGDFLDWFSRANACSMKHCMLPDVIYHRRFHQNNLGLKGFASAGDYVRALRAHLDRGNRRDSN